MRWQLSVQFVVGLGVMFGFAYMAVGDFVAPSLRVHARGTAKAEARAASTEVGFRWSELKARQRVLAKALGETAVLATLGAAFDKEGRTTALKGALLAAVSQSGADGHAVVIDPTGRLLASSSGTASLLAKSPSVADARAGAISVRFHPVGGLFSLVASAPIGSEPDRGVLVVSLPVSPAQLRSWTAYFPENVHVVAAMEGKPVATTLSEAVAETLRPEDLKAKTLNLGAQVYAVEMLEVVDDAGGTVQVFGLSRHNVEAVDAAVGHARLFVLMLGVLALLLALVLVALAPRAGLSALDAAMMAADSVDAPERGESDPAHPRYRVLSPPPKKNPPPQSSEESVESRPASVQGPAETGPEKNPQSLSSPRASSSPERPQWASEGPPAEVSGDWGEGADLGTPAPKTKRERPLSGRVGAAVPESSAGAASEDSTGGAVTAVAGTDGASPAVDDEGPHKDSAPAATGSDPSALSAGHAQPRDGTAEETSDENQEIALPPSVWSANAAPSAGSPASAAGVSGAPSDGDGDSGARIPEALSSGGALSWAESGGVGAPPSEVDAEASGDGVLDGGKSQGGLESQAGEVSAGPEALLEQGREAGGEASSGAADRSPSGVLFGAPTAMSPMPAGLFSPSEQGADSDAMDVGAQTDALIRRASSELPPLFSEGGEDIIALPGSPGGVSSHLPLDRLEAETPAAPKAPRRASENGSGRSGSHPGERTEAFDEGHYRVVYNEFVASKARLGESVERISFEGFSKKLRSSEESLMNQHGCRAVRFQVLVKDNTVSLRPRLVR